MKFTKEQFARIEHLMPTPRKAPTISNYDFLCAILYLIENGCKWRALPEKYGNWHTIYVKFNRWCKNGTIDKIFEALQTENIIEIRTEIVCIDSTSVKVHPDAAGARKSSGKRRAEYQPLKRGLTTKIHLASATARSALAFHLSPGNNHDAPKAENF